MSEHSHSDSTHGRTHFVVPVRYYLATLSALLVLTVLTVGVSRIDLGILNVAAALAIAIVKASLVMLFFMGMRWEKSFNVLIIIGTFFFMSIYFMFTLADTLARGKADPIETSRFGFKSPVKIIKPGEESSRSSHSESPAPSSESTAKH